MQVTCYAPQYLMGALVRLARESKEILLESGVIYLNVGYSVLLDNNAQEKVERSIKPSTVLICTFESHSITERQDLLPRTGEDST